MIRAQIRICGRFKERIVRAWLRTRGMNYGFTGGWKWRGPSFLFLLTDRADPASPDFTEPLKS
jgi:hypothetical protein